MDERGESRGAKQEINGPLTGDVAGRDIHNHHHAQGRLLTRAERRALHDRVKQLERDYDISGKQTWQAIHRIIGVDSIEELHLEQLRPTECILQLLLENAQLRAAESDTADMSEDPATAAALTRLTERNAHLGAALKTVEQERDRFATTVKDLTERNARLGTDLKQAQAARTSAESQLAKALQQIDMLRGQSQSVDRIAAERDRTAGAARDLQQQVHQLEAHLQGTSRRLAATRHKVVITSLGFAAAVLGCLYFGYRLLAVADAASKPAQQTTNASHPDTREREHPHPVAHSVFSRHHGTPHHSSMQQLPSQPGQMSAAAIPSGGDDQWQLLRPGQPPVIGAPSAGSDQVPGYISRDDATNN